MEIKIEKTGRLDKILAEILDITRTQIQLFIKKGNITVNGKVEKASYKVEIDDIVKVIVEEPKEVDILAQDISIDIVYQDEYIAVINKVAGITVHPAKGNLDNTLVNAIMYHIKDLSGINGEIRPGIVHRLDKNTSGLIIIAKNDIVHHRLVDMFKNKEIKKTYLAIIKGIPREKTGRIENIIGRDKKDRKRMTVLSPREERGKLAITNYEIITHNDRYSLIKLGLETGRTHQIRVHMRHLGMPILGDEVYGRKDFANRQMLHAYHLEFIHPITDEKMSIYAHLHDDFKKAYIECKLDKEVLKKYE